MKFKIFNFYYKKQFIINFLSVFLNSSYFIRLGLYRYIKKHAKKLYGSVLDFGCGKKPYQSLFVNAATYTGLDIKLNKDSKKNVFADIYYEGNIIPLNDESYDNIFSSESFELISNPDIILKEIYRVLKKDGFFLITVPFVWEEHWLPYDYCRYSSSGIRTLLERNGFSIVCQNKSTTYFETAWQMFIFYLYQNVFPSNKIIKSFLTIFCIGPLNLLGIFLNFILPNNKEHLFYHNNIVLARKN